MANESIMYAPTTSSGMDEELVLPWPDKLPEFVGTYSEHAPSTALPFFSLSN